MSQKPSKGRERKARGGRSKRRWKGQKGEKKRGVSNIFFLTYIFSQNRESWGSIWGEKGDDKKGESREG